MVNSSSSFNKLWYTHNNEENTVIKTDTSCAFLVLIQN